MMLTKEDLLVLAVNQLLMAAEESTLTKIKASSEAQELANTREQILTVFQETCASGSIDRMLALERDTVEWCKERYVNSEAMQKSQDAALVNIDAIQANADLIRDPSNDYRTTLITHAKRIKDNLPYDAGREALKSHYTQLVNLDKANLSDEEKKIIDARKELMREVEKIYIELQKQALGMTHPSEPEPEPAPLPKPSFPRMGM